MQTQNWFLQFAARLTSATPVFFKKLVLFGISLGVIGGAILGVSATNVVLPPFLVELSGYLVTAGVVCAAIAKATTTDPNLQAAGGSNVIVNNQTTPPESTVAAESPPIPKV